MDTFDGLRLTSTFRSLKTMHGNWVFFVPGRSLDHGVPSVLSGCNCFESYGGTY